MIIDEEDYLAHYGILRRSGRYPWGSGGNESQRNKGFLDYVEECKAQGMSEVEIARGMGVSTTELRAAKSIAKAEQKASQIAEAQRLKEKGYSNVAGAERMGIPESTYRTLLEPGARDKSDLLTSTSNMLKEEVAKKTYVDVGKGVEAQVNVSRNKLDIAVAMCREEGYELHSVKIPTAIGNETELKVLCPPGTTQKDVFLNRNNIQQIKQFSDDNGRSFYGLHDPISIDPKRVGVVYGSDGGKDADGVIYVRPGAKDLDLGNARYAQVRIKVGEGHYLKGMAMYKDGMPDGVDLLFNTNKERDTPMYGEKDHTIAKNIKDDVDNPFGSIVHQIVADKGLPTEHVTSAMNIVNEEGDWGHWSKTIASQVLSKQSPALAKSQLDMTYEARVNEFNSLSNLTNGAVKKKMLMGFADGTDSASVHLKAAALPRSGWHAILPIQSLPPNQIYAPNYENGERVALIRYPHGGTFEIPDVIVNNNHPEAKRLLGSAKDAVGIHPSVANHLSGADFDGDTILVIPNNKGHVVSTPALEGLKDFDTKAAYPGYPGMKKLTPARKQQEMGKVSNLITDMTLRRASTSELAQAVRHSMVIIDAEKHGLNWKQSELDNGIQSLKAKYQGGPNAGASTLISKANAKVYIPEKRLRKASEGGPVNKETGERIFVETGRTRMGSKGERVPVLQKSKRLAETDDANTLSSGTRMEVLYADHSNKLKSLANQARLEATKTPPTKYNASARKAYKEEVASLNDKLALTVKNAPLERQAQIIANTVVKAKKNENPNMDDATLKKIKYQALEEARTRTGAKKHAIVITESEWNAIQAGAISDSKLSQILEKADMEVVRELATPKTVKMMTPAKTKRAIAMLNSGYTRAEVARQLGVSLSTLDVATNE